MVYLPYCPSWLSLSSWFHTHNSQIRSVGTVACRMLRWASTHRGLSVGSAAQNTQEEKGKLLCGQLGRAVVKSPDKCPLEALSSAAMVRRKRKIMFFGRIFHYFFNGINSNSLLDVPLRGMITAAYGNQGCCTLVINLLCTCIIG